MGCAGVAKAGDEENTRSFAGSGPALNICAGADAGAGVGIGSSIFVYGHIILSLPALPDYDFGML